MDESKAKYLKEPPPSSPVTFPDFNDEVIDEMVVNADMETVTFDVQDFFEKWQTQPCTDTEISEYEHDQIVCGLRPEATPHYQVAECPELHKLLN